MLIATKATKQTYAEIATRIIKSQEDIIGPLALQQAQKVSGLRVSWQSKKVEIQGDSAKVIDNLVKQYEALFGSIAVETCRDVTKQLVSKLPEQERPKSLA